MKSNSKQDVVWTYCPNCWDRYDHEVDGDYVICPKCKGRHTAPKYPGIGGCDTCRGDGVVKK